MLTDEQKAILDGMNKWDIYWYLADNPDDFIVYSVCREDVECDLHYKCGDAPDTDMPDDDWLKFVSLRDKYFDFMLGDDHSWYTYEFCSYYGIKGADDEQSED